MAVSSSDKSAFTNNSIGSTISKKSSEIVGASKKVISSSVSSVAAALTGKSKAGEEEEELSKVALIMGKVQAMLEELDDYSVYIAGHSLGGALSLIFAMEAAVQLKTPYPVTVFALGNPRTGNLDFRHVICVSLLMSLLCFFALVISSYKPLHNHLTIIVARRERASPLHVHP
jgi:predicted lipase